MKLRYFSGFSGIGGFDQGITQVIPEAECIGFSEVDRYAIKIYEKHFPNRTNYGNIKEINEKELPDFNMFCGGFPCQDFSIAGKRAGLCGARSGLFFEIIKIIREKQPRIVFLENVKGIFSSNGGWDFARILLELDESGYDIEWQCLNSKNFGVPQNRERVFIIGHLRGKSWRPVFPIRAESNEIQETTNGKCLCAGTLSTRNQSGQAQWDGSTALISNAIDAKHFKGMDNHGQRTMIISDSGVNRKSQLRIENIAPLRANTDAGHNNVVIQSHHPRCGDPAKGGTGELSSSVYTYTIDSIPHIVNQIRRLTPLECERLQGYPDRWTEGISDTQRYKCLGNAVTVNVIDAIVRRMHKNAYRPKSHETSL